ncbi:MAG: hypothetical protein ACU0CO_09000 [Shimia sp.]
MLRFLFTLLVLLSAGAASATPSYPLPGLHAVTGVASDDVLNIRAEPRGSADRLGAFAPFADGIEVVRTTRDGTWGRVRVPGSDAMGWASMRYLTPTGPDGFALPALSCGGTEPFWSLDYDPHGRDRYERPGFGATTIALPPATLSANDLGASASFGLSAGGVSFVATFRRQSCSDGMSDLEYGVAVTLLRLAGAEPEVLSGCCSVAR